MKKKFTIYFMLSAEIPQRKYASEKVVVEINTFSGETTGIPITLKLPAKAILLRKTVLPFPLELTALVSL